MVFPLPLPNAKISNLLILSANSPGRYYASAIMKIIMGQVIMKYDCELLHGNGSRFLEWRSTILPKSNIKVAFRPVETEATNRF